MLYGKIPVILLTTVVTENDGSLNRSLASYILKNIESVKSMGIVELAKNCNVSISSVSRFCNDIGFQDFSEFKELLIDPQMNVEVVSDNPKVEERIHELFTQVATALVRVEQSIDVRCIDLLCKDLLAFEQVTTLGMLKASSAAICLQNDLSMAGKMIATHPLFQQQKEFLLGASKDDLLIIFSYTGTYFDYFDMNSLTHLRDVKIYFITGNPTPSHSEYLDVIISFNSELNQVSHPYQLLSIANVISQEYVRYISKR